MVQFSVKSLLISAALLALSLDGIYADDTCQADESRCSITENLLCCDGSECYNSNGEPGAVEGVCRPATNNDATCAQESSPCQGAGTCCGELECVSASGDGSDAVCQFPNSGSCEPQDRNCQHDSHCCPGLM
ncbi:hypothetical protein BJV82DRAFT_712538, partial [Fennellomyces sp. T-0311]